MSNPFVYHFSQVNATPLDGGSVKVVDSSTFAVSTAIAAAEVTVEPGAMRELHVRTPSRTERPQQSRENANTTSSGTPLRMSGPTTCEP